jgi:acetyl-CoA synthetase
MDSLLREHRVFPPPAAFAQRAWIQSAEQYDALYRRSIEEPEAFWAEAARELDWFKPFDTVLEGAMSNATWFNGGQINLAHNCVDRHANGPLRDKAALIWEAEPVSEGRSEVRTLTFAELHLQVQVFANVLKKLGVRNGDRVAIYMGM